MSWRSVLCSCSLVQFFLAHSKLVAAATPLYTNSNTGERNLRCSHFDTRPSLRRGTGRGKRIIVEDRHQPFLRLVGRPAFALGVVLDLIALDLADAEIVAVGMAEIKSADGGTRPHRKTFGELDADLALAFEQIEQRALLGMVRLRRIAWRRPDAAIFLRDEIVGRERLVDGIAPELLWDALMRQLGECFRETISQCLHEDRRVVVIRLLKAIG